MSIKLTNVGDGKVYLIAGGNKIYTDIAARFVRSERSVKEIIESPYDPKIVRNILESGHGAALEFDYFIFGVEGYSRVCEVQLVRKRIASYLIKSGRQELNGKREYSVVFPKELKNTNVEYTIRKAHTEEDYDVFNRQRKLIHKDKVSITLNPYTLNEMIEYWYNQNLEKGYKEEDLRYLKPLATEFKAIIGMNIHALRDWWKIRLCELAQFEIRDLAYKMFKLVKEVAPDLVEGAGPSCKVLGYCPEGRLQCNKFKGIIPTEAEAKELIKKYYKKENNNE